MFAAQRMGVTPTQVLVVEDTPTGISAAKAAGMQAIGFAATTPAPNLGQAGANAVVHDMHELKASMASARGSQPG